MSNRASEHCQGPLSKLWLPHILLLTNVSVCAACACKEPSSISQRGSAAVAGTRRRWTAWTRYPKPYFTTLKPCSDGCAGTRCRRRRCAHRWRPRWRRWAWPRSRSGPRTRSAAASGSAAPLRARSRRRPRRAHLWSSSTRNVDHVSVLCTQHAVFKHGWRVASLHV